MANAKAKGRQVGRRPTNKDDIPAIFYKHYPAYVAEQMNVSEPARICDLRIRYNKLRKLKKT